MLLWDWNFTLNCPRNVRGTDSMLGFNGSLLLRRFVFRMASAKREWLVMNRKGPWEGYRCPLPAFLCAHIFIKRETSGYEAALMDCASIICGIIPHYEHNFDLFSIKSTASKFALLASFAAQNWYSLIVQSVFFGLRIPKSVSQVHLINKINCLLSYLWVVRRRTLPRDWMHTHN